MTESAPSPATGHAPPGATAATVPAGATAALSEPDPLRAPSWRFADPDYRPLAASLAEVRAGIDALDDQIVALIARRAMFVKDAARFKRDLHQVAAPARQAQVYAGVRALAQRHDLGFEGLSDVVEAAYRAMVAAFIAQESRYFHTLLPADAPAAPAGSQEA